MLEDILHNAFFYLSLPEGVLLKRAVELVIFSLVTYMIVSEYLRTKENELRYLSIAFGALAIQKFVLSIVFALEIFTKTSLINISPFIPSIEFASESLAIILLVNAFMYPVQKKLFPYGKWNYFALQFIFWVIISIAIQIAWFFSPLIGTRGGFLYFIGYPIFLVFNAFFLMLPIAFWIAYGRKEKYFVNVILAFSVYLMSWLIKLTNYFFFSNQSNRLIVAEVPFPLIAALILTQIIYLKLVDKATLQEKLRESEEKLFAEKKISEMKDEFISAVSHELRTPLTSMKLYLSLLKSGKFGDLNEKQKESLLTVKTEADRLHALIEDLLDIAKLESGKANLHISLVNLYELVSLRSEFAMAAEKGLTIDIKIPSKFMVKVDSDRFKQIISNLLSNAIKYSDKGKIVIGAKRIRKGFLFFIKDSGRGIPKDRISKIFDKFYQIESHMTRTQQGSGLGLAIVKKIVDLHKGQIEVTSRPKHGSTFAITIPQ